MQAQIYESRLETYAVVLNIDSLRGLRMQICKMRNLKLCCGAEYRFIDLKVTSQANPFSILYYGHLATYLNNENLSITPTKNVTI